MKRRALFNLIASTTALFICSAAAEAGGSAGDLALFGKDPGSAKAFACYAHHYDPAHLASHPRQNVGDMTLFVNSFVDADMGRQYTLEIGVHFRATSAPFQVTGGCGSFSDGEDILNCGVDCDGGVIDVSVKDANSILVSIPDGARTWSPGTEDAPSADAKFGADDKLFRLQRTKLQDCLPLIADDDIKAEITAGQ